MRDLDDLAVKVRGLSPPDKLILAAELMRAGRSRLALTIAGEVVDGLRLSDILCEPAPNRDAKGKGK